MGGAAGGAVVEARVDGAGLAMWLRTVDRICRGRVGEGTWTFSDGGLIVEWSGIHNSFAGVGGGPDEAGGQGTAMVEPDQMRTLAQDCPRLPELRVQASSGRLRLGSVEAEAQVEIELAAEKAALFVGLEEQPARLALVVEVQPEAQGERGQVGGQATGQEAKPEAPARRTKKRAALEALHALSGEGGEGAAVKQAGGASEVGGEIPDLRSGEGDSADLRSGEESGADLRLDEGCADLRSGEEGGADLRSDVVAEPPRPAEVPPMALLPLFSALPAPEGERAEREDVGEARGEARASQGSQGSQESELRELREPGEQRGGATVIELQPWALPENTLMARGAPLAEVLALRWRYDGATLGRAGVARAVAAAHRQKEHLIGQAAALLEPLGVPQELLERWVEAHLEAKATGRESFSIGNVVYIDKKSRQVKLFGG